MPPLEAVTINPVHKVIHLGPLSVAQRRRLEAEIDAAQPSGAPAAGFGGASTGSGVGGGHWLAAGGVLVALSGLGGFAFWRRRRTG